MPLARLSADAELLGQQAQRLVQQLSERTTSRMDGWARVAAARLLLLQRPRLEQQTLSGRSGRSVQSRAEQTYTDAGK